MDQNDDLLAKIDEAIAASDSFDSPSPAPSRTERVRSKTRSVAFAEEDMVDLTPTLEAIKDLQAKLDLSFNMQDAIQIDLNKSRIDLKKAQEKNSGLEAEVAGLRATGKENEKSLEKLQDELSFLEEEKLIGDEKVQELQEQLRKKDQDFADLKNEIKLKGQDKKSQAKENDDLRGHLASRESHISELEKEISKISDSREKYQNRVKELEREASSLRYSKEALLEIRKALTDTNAKVRERFYRNRENS
jgi:chromosome segregation ATPase